MRARKGFISTAFAVIIALMLGMTAMYAVKLGAMVVREETRMTEEMQRSLYPIAWSTTNFVLESMMEAYANPSAALSQQVRKVFLSGDSPVSPISTDIITFAVPIPSGNDTFWISCDVKVEGRIESPRVKTRAYANRYGSIEVKGFLSPDISGNYTIVWR